MLTLLYVTLLTLGLFTILHIMSVVLVKRARSSKGDQVGSVHQINERIGNVGSFNGKDIPEFITMDDGKRFEFESIAVKFSNGIYAAKDPDKLYVTIDDDKLLYKLVPAC